MFLKLFNIAAVTIAAINFGAYFYTNDLNNIIIGLLFIETVLLRLKLEKKND